MAHSEEATWGAHVLDWGDWVPSSPASAGTHTGGQQVTATQVADLNREQTPVLGLAYPGPGGNLGSESVDTESLSICLFVK